MVDRSDIEFISTESDNETHNGLTVGTASIIDKEEQLKMEKNLELLYILGLISTIIAVFSYNIIWIQLILIGINGFLGAVFIKRYII